MNRELEEAIFEASQEAAEIRKAEQKEKEAAMKSKKPNRFTHNRYRIFRVEVDPKTKKETQITMKKFWAKTNAEAQEELKKYIKIANKQYKYYWGTAENYVDYDSKTKKKVCYDTMEDMHQAWEKRRKWYSELWFNITYYFSKVTDLRYTVKDIWYWFRTKHNRSESWSLDSHIVEDILHNVPIMIKNLHGWPSYFSLEALKEKHKNDPKFDVEKALTANPNLCWEEKCDERALELWKEKLNELLLCTRLFVYYDNYGIVHEKDVEMNEIAKKYKSTIPYVPGTYKQIDYVKLDKLTTKNWNKIWDWIRVYGRNLWD